MRVDLYPTPEQIDEMALREKTVVVIDVLRASTTIATALQHGAKEIIPVATVEAAMKISQNLINDVTLLGGERGGKVISGFHLGNSPAEYTEEKVKGKSIIFSSTNGSVAMTRSRHAHNMVVCGFVNMSAVAGFLGQSNHDVIIACAGREGSFSLEDTVCAGMLIGRVQDADPAPLALSDGALAALILYRSVGHDILKVLQESEHGRYLQSIGFGDDLEVCARVDSVPVLPQVANNVLKLKRDGEKVESTHVTANA